VSKTNPGIQYVFLNWQDGVKSPARTIAVPSNNATYQAIYKTQVLVTLTANPANGGTVAGGGWVDLNSGTTLTATPAPGYFFAGFTGDFSNGTSPFNLATIAQPANLVANFSANPQVTIASTPSNQVIYVDNVAYTTPHVFTWLPGDHHSLDATKITPPQGTHLIFTGWSDSGAASHQITVPANNTTFTASFATSYLLTINTQGPGTVAPSPASPTGDGYYPAGSSVTLTATPQQQGYAVTFGGALSGTANPQTLQMTAPTVVSVKFSANPITTIQTAFTGLVATVDGTNTSLPAAFAWDPGSTHTVSFPSPQTPTPGQQYVFAKWDDGTAGNSRTFQGGAQAATYIADFNPLDLVAVTIVPANGGQVAGGGWYAPNSPVTLTATAAGGYAFAGFSGDVQALTSPQTVPVSKPLSVTATFVPAQPLVTASVASINDQDPNTVQLALNLNNTGKGMAAGLTITSITATLLAGTGPVSVGQLPSASLSLAGGQNGRLPVSFSWPSTASRVRLLVQFSANGGTYTGSQTLTIFR
jgi:hypothetical protein